MRLGVVDQSPVPAGSTPADALAATVDLARRTEAMGYTRYWLAEHHGSDGLAGSAPEVLVGAVAAGTSRMRVGSGGVMLSHYAPLKVAEQFHVLAALHGDRIDLGIGRAPGSDPSTAYALARQGRPLDPKEFPAAVVELLDFLDGRAPEHPVLRDVTAAPLPGRPLPVWSLCSSAEGAGLAAHLGIPLAWAHFITAEDGPAVVDAYRRHHRPGGRSPEPQVLIAVSALCADTAEEADRLAGSIRLWRRRGLRGPIPTPGEAAADEARDDPLTVVPGRKPMLVGSPDEVADGIRALAADHGVDEVLVVTICHDHEARVRSYELLADALLPAG